MTRTSRFAPSFALAVLIAFAISISPPAYGGILATTPEAVTFSSFQGSGSFSSGALSGDLDYAVFTAAEFDTAFPTASYSPTDAVVYAYQLENTNDAAISMEVVGVTNPANGIDSFLDTAGEIAPSGALFSSGNAIWLFGGLLNGEVSEILVFSSPNTPVLGASLTVKGGTSAILEDVPTPGPDAIPEPASFALLGIASMCWLVMRRR